MICEHNTKTQASSYPTPRGFATSSRLRASAFPIASLVLLAFLSCSCSRLTSSGNYIVDELSTRGITQLSPDNPYSPANLLVSSELPKSKIAKGFLDYRGKPDALLVTKSLYEPLRISLFYKDRGEVFYLTKRRDWIVDGPVDAAKAGFARMDGPTMRSGGEESKSLKNPGEIPGVGIKNEGARSQATKGQSDIRSELERILGTAGGRGSSETFARKSEPPAILRPSLSHGRYARFRFEEASGDLVHIVSFRGETLRIISEWYTGDSANAGRIARINDIRNPNLLQLDQEVKIPRYLLKQRTPLPAFELERYLKKFGLGPK